MNDLQGGDVEVEPGNYFVIMGYIDASESDELEYGLVGYWEESEELVDEQSRS